MKFFGFLTVLILGFSAQAVTVECINYRTNLLLELDNNIPHQTLTVQLEDKEGFVTEGVETYEFYFDSVESKKGGAVFVTSNDDYYITLKLPKTILSKTPRKSFTAEFIPLFDGLRPRYNELTCKVK